MYSSATYTKPSPDLPQYRVDRHTPRANRAQRRSFSSPEDQAPSTGKKIKLEAAGSETASHREPRGQLNVLEYSTTISVLLHTQVTLRDTRL